MILHYGEPVNVIFVHIPKTAGTTMQSVLRPHLKGSLRCGGQKTDWNYHTKAVDFRARLNNYDEYYKFSLVRNPWDRLYSWASMLLGKKQTITKARFKQWVMTNPNASIPQSTWFTDYDNKIIVDYVGKFEYLDFEINHILQELKLPTISNIPHKRQSLRVKNYQEMYDDEMMEFVAYHHRQDIEWFDYSF